MIPDPTDAQACHQASLRLLQYRWRSRHELEQKLLRQGFEPAAVAATLERLESEKWIDDERFAGEMAASLARRRHGRLRIERDLGRFGVDRDVIQRALESAGEEHDPEEALAALCRRRIEILQSRHGNDYVRGEVGRGKLTRYLMSRGYDGWAVADIVEKQLRPSPDWTND
ncbi:MAG TPA: regulatory protein RecX [Thermoanaerobaculia bacterium]|nr:regulatory protein RecX [Thermoanaerobaculia bacterium]